MGIANSDLIKAGVDFLTLLLNGVNKLTDGFGLLTGSVGGFISSILKVGLLLGGLNLGKSLIGGGIGGIGSLLSGQKFTEGFSNIVNPKALLRNFFGPFSMMGKGLSGLGKKELGKSIWGGAKGLGGTILGKVTGLGPGLGLGLEAGALEGVIGLTTAIGGITAVAGAAYIAIKKLYDLSPAGQVKIAEKYTNTIKKVADEAKKTETSLKDAQTKYKEYSQAISDSSNVQDHSKAIQDRNEYLTSLLEQDASFAKYI